MEQRFYHVIFVSSDGTIFPSQKLFTTEEKATIYSREFMAKCIDDNDLPQFAPHRNTVLEYMVAD